MSIKNMGCILVEGKGPEAFVKNLNMALGNINKNDELVRIDYTTSYKEETVSHDGVHRSALVVYKSLERE